MGFCYKTTRRTAATHVRFCGKSRASVREQYYYYVLEIINNDDKSKPLRYIILCVHCEAVYIDKAYKAM